MGFYVEIFCRVFRPKCIFFLMFFLEVRVEVFLRFLIDFGNLFEITSNIANISEEFAVSDLIYEGSMERWWMMLESCMVLARSFWSELETLKLKVPMSGSFLVL